MRPELKTQFSNADSGHSLEYAWCDAFARHYREFIKHYMYDVYASEQHFIETYAKPDVGIYWIKEGSQSDRGYFENSFDRVVAELYEGRSELESSLLDDFIADFKHRAVSYIDQLHHDHIERIRSVYERFGGRNQSSDSDVIIPGYGHKAFNVLSSNGLERIEFLDVSGEVYHLPLGAALGIAKGFALLRLAENITLERTNLTVKGMLIPREIKIPTGYRSELTKDWTREHAIETIDLINAAFPQEIKAVLRGRDQNYAKLCAGKFSTDYRAKSKLYIGLQDERSGRGFFDPARTMPKQQLSPQYEGEPDSSPV